MEYTLTILENELDYRDNISENIKPNFNAQLRIHIAGSECLTNILELSMLDRLVLSNLTESWFQLNNPEGQ